uniref:Fibronectin type-II domain-containing protein n=1 Tax=Scleropages formosus TaxID=113540 RepID=A0A8C9TC38_SCLFO
MQPPGRQRSKVRTCAVLCSLGSSIHPSIHLSIYPSIHLLQDISPDYCVFPFKYKDHWYYSCTSVDSKHKRLWCSLTTDFDKDHLWGYCLGNVNFCKCHCHPLNQYHGKCFTQVNVSIFSLKSSAVLFSFVILLCLAESSCVFPFIAGGKTYNHCTTDYWFPGISWCSTTANYDGDKKWVYCPSSGTVLYCNLSIARHPKQDSNPRPTGEQDRGPTHCATAPPEKKINELNSEMNSDCAKKSFTSVEFKA